MLGSQIEKEERVNVMRKFQKMLAASVLVLLPTAYASAQQQDYQGGGRQRQYGQYNGQNNGGDQQSGQDRQSRRQRNFGDNGGFGGGNNGGFGNGGYGGNGGGFNNGGGFGRQRSFDSGNSSTSSTPTVTKSDPNKSTFVPPVATGPFTFSVQQLPKEYALLNNRSIFSKDHRAIQPDEKKPVFENAPVAALVLRGAMRLDAGAKPYAAQIEDINSSKAPTWVSEGDLLTASGARVTEITLDHIVVEKNGVRRLITIGVNLDQGEKLPTPSSGTASVSPTASAGAEESQVKIAASAGNTSEEDVADMMRRRRQAQLGQ